MTPRPRGKILIVDDVPQNLAAFSATLEPLGAEIVTAPSGKEALRAVLRDDLAVMLLDVQMPEMDGYETARLIRTREHSRRLPIIFLTAMPRDDALVARGYAAGAVDFIVKPVNPDILRSKVEVFLELHEKNAIIREQTEQLRLAAEQKLIDYQRWSEERYASLADTVPELVWTASETGKLTYRNQRWVECAGRDAPDLDFGDIVEPDALPQFLGGVKSAIENGLAYESEIRMGNVRQGRFRWHLVRIVPTRAADGRVTGFIGTSTDVEALKRTQQKLQEAGRAKDVFLATLSHELRTPLNAIVGWSHLLKSSQLDRDHCDRAVETIDRNARALAKLVGDLIDVSRIVSGNLTVELQEVDLGQIVDGALDAAAPSIAAAELTLEVERSEGPHVVCGDATRLSQIVGNLISNAIKFTPRGGKIRVGLRAEHGRARLMVSDTGQGIPEEFLPFVFEPFRQARRTHARSQEGLGLGLAIVKRLVELHQGTVTAHSEGVGSGSTIEVELPMQREDAGQPSRDSISGVRASPKELLAGVHALVVEDDPDGCELLETVLRSFGATVSTAGTASAAYKVVCRQRPDVIVSDIGLPDEDGLSLIRRIRKIEGMSELPALALTAYASQRDVDQALAAGFQAHVAKPVAPLELGAAIARLYGR